VRPGSAEGSIAWFVRAVVDRRLAPDANAKQPLTVRVPAEPLAAWAQTPLAPALGCAMEISASSRVARPGDTITGTLRLRPDGAINARAVRVQLKRVRYDPDRNTDVDDSIQVPLRGEGELAPGAIETFDFAITVPPTAPPSFQAHYNHQHWYLQGVVDVRRAKDPTVSVEVVVHTA
jgi:hypothetical protein